MSKTIRCTRAPRTGAKAVFARPDGLRKGVEWL